MLDKLFESDGYVDSGRMPSERPYQVLEGEDEVRVSESYFTGEAPGGQDFGAMTGEEAANFLREFDIAADSNYPALGDNSTDTAGFPHENIIRERPNPSTQDRFWNNFGPDFDSWDSYRIDLNEDGTGRINVKASDPIMGFFVRYTSLEFEF